jgi:HSP20 family protein
MANLVRSEPGRDMLSLREAMDRLFEESFLRPGFLGTGESVTSPLPLDMYETEDRIVVKAAVPGVRPEDINVTVTGDLLSIAGEFKTESEQKDDRRNYLRQERRYGSFSRQITLPAGVNADQCAATYENGVLTLELPKVEQARTKSVKIIGKNQEAKNG